MVRTVILEQYYPNIMKNVREFQNIAEVENPEFNDIWININNALKDEFINDFTENGANRWEKLLKIRPRAADTLDIRRARILSKINRQLPYTHRILEQMLAVICGEDKSSVILDYNKYALSVKLDPSVMGNIDDVDELLKVVPPANLTRKMVVERPINMELSVGQILKVAKKITINPANQFGLNRIDGTGIYGFVTRTARKTIIKAVI